MNLSVPKGKYILAVSGGVDSMVLLDILTKQAKSQKPKAKGGGIKLSAKDFQLIVAHFNHGIREDARQDEKLVAQTAKKYGLPLEVGRRRLGKAASEEAARAARYKFLRSAKTKHGADAIITAHHQDDLIETAIINLLRGTGRRGLSSMAQNPEIIRPLLQTPKKSLVAYAKAHKLQWREDKTNTDTRYLRNYIRLRLVPKLTAAQKKQLLDNIEDLNILNPILDEQIAILSQSIESSGKISRQKFVNLPPDVASEVLIYCLRHRGITQIDKQQISRLVAAIKTARPGSRYDISRGTYLLISSRYAQIVTGAN